MFIWVLIKKILLAIVDVLALLIRATGLQFLQLWLRRKYRNNVSEQINELIQKVSKSGKGNKAIANRAFWGGIARQAINVICIQANNSKGEEVSSVIDKKAVVFIDGLNNIHFVDVESLGLKVDIATDLNGELIPIPEGCIAKEFKDVKSIMFKTNLQEIWMGLYPGTSLADEPLYKFSYSVSMASPFTKFGFCISSTSPKRAQKQYDKVLSKYFEAHKVDLPFVETHPGTYKNDEVPYSITDYKIRDINKGYKNKAGKDIKSDGEDVYVFVLDTGINDETNPEEKDFVSNIVKKFSRNFTSSNEKDYQDRQSHGTHVAGTIASSVYGVAPNVKLVAVKVLNDNGSGTYDGITSAINYVTDIKNKHNLKNVVINMSLGGPYPYGPMERAIAKAAENGVIVCMAAGNSGDTRPDNDIGYPGKYAGKYNVLAIAAIDSNRKRAYFSSDGDELTIAAPGVKILSSDHRGRKVKYSGTSMATPFVSGTIALIMSLKTLDAKSLKNVLMEKADKVEGENAKRYYGSGIVNPKAKVEAVV